ncbi:UxaA family hydrolase, partial [Pseudocitrobacter faecalis]
LANRWYDLMDINAGTIATGEETIEDVGWKLFHFILDVASGKKILLNTSAAAVPYKK